MEGILNCGENISICRVTSFNIQGILNCGENKYMCRVAARYMQGIVICAEISVNLSRI
jgi:hypothetical protein